MNTRTFLLLSMLPYYYATCFTLSSLNFQTLSSLSSSSSSSSSSPSTLLRMDTNGKENSNNDAVSLLSEQEQEQEQPPSPLDPKISAQFKILTCSSTACTKRSRQFGLDEYAIFSGLYQRKEGLNDNDNDNDNGIGIRMGAPEVTVEESGCLGSCKVGPCVGIEHEDYYGRVALEGMKPNEFKDAVFQNIVTEEDLDRVWSSVENSIRVMMEQEEDDE